MIHKQSIIMDNRSVLEEFHSALHKAIGVFAGKFQEKLDSPIYRL
jgi:hypothetical protein